MITLTTDRTDTAALHVPTAREKNEGRARAGRRSLEAFRPPAFRFDVEGNLLDLLANLRHLADAEGISWATLLERVDQVHSDEITRELRGLEDLQP